MSEGKFAFKSAIVFLWLAVVIGLLCMFTRPVHALDSFQVYPDSICRGQDGTIRYGYGLFEDVDFVGVQFTAPIPEHADGDHYSIYFRMTYQLPAGDDVLAQRLMCAPYSYASTLSNSLGGTVVNNLLDGAGSTANAWNMYGGFNYLGRRCTYNILVSRVKNGGDTYFSVSGVFDFNLFNEDESMPIRLGIFWPNAIQGFNVYNVQCYVWTLDTLEQQYLIDIEDAINNLDFSVDLSVLESQVAEIYSFDTSFYSDLMAALENPSFSDPELTQAENAAASLSDIIADVGSVEEAVLGTLNPDWNQFPTGVDMQNVGTYFLPFFSNPIIFALVSACLALMIVFAII